MIRLTTLLLLAIIVSCTIPNQNKLTAENGVDGISCWDLNANGVAESNEDINQDGNFNGLDCQGADGADGQGEDGTDGTNGNDGLSCWDTNGNGQADSDEDVNQDGNYDALDCQGQDGANCYDQIGDWNGDGIIDTYDCIDFDNTPCQDVGNTDHCVNRKQYVVWIDGTYFSNVNLLFKQNGDRAVLCGEIKKHGSSSIYNVWVEFERGQEDEIKEPKCEKNWSSDDWIQYTSFSGTIIKENGSVIYEIERRGEAFQVGTDANVTERKEGLYNASGWFTITSHDNCEGDFNFNLKCL